MWECVTKEISSALLLYSKTTTWQGPFGGVSAFVAPCNSCGNKIRVFQTIAVHRFSEVYGARSTVINNMASDIRPLDFQLTQDLRENSNVDLATRASSMIMFKLTTMLALVFADRLRFFKS